MTHMVQLSNKCTNCVNLATCKYIQHASFGVCASDPYICISKYVGEALNGAFISLSSFVEDSIAEHMMELSQSF